MTQPRKPLDPALERQVREHFTTVPLLGTLGVILEELSAGFCEMRLPIRPEWCQEHGYLHGGLVGTLLDSAAGHAATTVLPEGYDSVTVEYKVNFLAPARGEVFIARAEVLKAGRSLVVLQSHGYGATGGVETRCASAIVTYMVLAPRE